MVYFVLNIIIHILIFNILLIIKIVFYIITNKNTCNKWRKNCLFPCKITNNNLIQKNININVFEKVIQLTTNKN